MNCKEHCQTNFSMSYRENTKYIEQSNCSSVARHSSLPALLLQLRHHRSQPLLVCNERGLQGCVQVRTSQQGGVQICLVSMHSPRYHAKEAGHQLLAVVLLEVLATALPSFISPNLLVGLNMLAHSRPARK